MIKRKAIIVIAAIMILSAPLFGCTKQEPSTSGSNIPKPSETEQNEEAKDSLDQPHDTGTKVEGRREFLERLGNIQKELDDLPEKKDSDAGITNAMRSYYGRAYEAYDKEINEIYVLLKSQLSQETMENLQTEQIEWIKQKEAAAKNEASQYKGGTFEFVANYMSLYQATKTRCYELVNQYMTD